jgi:hypothetical protein
MQKPRWTHEPPGLFFWSKRLQRIDSMAEEPHSLYLYRRTNYRNVYGKWKSFKMASFFHKVVILSEA